MGRGRPPKSTTKKTFIRTGRPVSEKIIICVVYKKPNSKKHYLDTYKNLELDSILSNRKHTPVISDKFEIVDIGVGKSFIEKYKKQYKIEKITIQD